MSEDRLFDETALRTALRLDADERPPRLDPARLRLAAAPEDGVAFGLARGLVLVTFAVAVAGIAIGGARFALELLALAASPDAFAIALAGLAVASEVVASIARVAAEPATPLAIFAALLVAFAHERRLGRNGHARAS